MNPGLQLSERGRLNHRAPKVSLPILGMLTGKYVRKRYADEIDRFQCDLYGED